MSEVPRVKMQLVESNDGVVLLDMEPPVDDDREQLIRGVPALHGVPDDALRFRELVPDSGEPLTEVNCTRIRNAAEENDLNFNEQNFAREIWNVLTNHGYTVTLDAEKKPIEQRGYTFLSTTPETSPDA